jgi:hypothetical protein
MECICISMPCKCLYALKSYLWLCGYMWFACKITISCMLRMDLFHVVLSAELFCCVSEGAVVVKDVWHVYMVGVKLSGCMSATPEVNRYVCSLPKRSSHIYLFVWNKRSMVSDCLMLGSGA